MALNTIMLIVVVLIVVTLSVENKPIMPSVIMLSVVAPLEHLGTMGLYTWECNQLGKKYMSLLASICVSAGNPY